MNTKVKNVWTLASVALTDAYTDFTLSRQAMQCTPATMQFYRYTAGTFLRWTEEQGITSPEQIDARIVRQYIAQLVGADTSIHDHARAIRTLLRFWHAEGYMANSVHFDMPRLAKKKLPVLTAEQLQRLLKDCDVREKALVLFMVDSGLRREEVCNLNWSDVNMQTGLVRVIQGKGRKDRSSVISPKTRRALLQYKRVAHYDLDIPLFQSERGGGRLTGEGIRLIFRRLSQSTGIHVTAHALRRTFAILSLRAGMSLLHLQNLGGWAGLEMVNHYSQMTDEDLLAEHSKHSPIENL